MHVDHSRYRKRTQTRPSVASVPYCLIRRAIDAIFARAPLAHENTVRTGHAKIVKRLNCCYAFRPYRLVHARGYLRKNIMGVYDIRPERSDRVDHRGDPTLGVGRLIGGSETVPPCSDASVVEEQSLYALTRAPEAIDFLRHH